MATGISDPAKTPQSGKDSGSQFETLTVRLIKPFSWKDSFTKYPALLADADPDRVYSTRELYEGVLCARVPKQGDPLQWTLAFVGIEPQLETNSCQVRGLAFAQLTPDTVQAGGRGLDGRYIITETGRRLGDAYRADPKGARWTQIFAEAVARRDPYSRVFLAALAAGATLRFPANPSRHGFGKQMGLCKLGAGENATSPLTNTRRRVKSRTDKKADPAEKIDKANHPFVQLMRAHPEQTVGPFLLADMAAYRLDTSLPMHIAGARRSKGGTPDPSVNEIDLYLRQSLALFVQIGVIVYREREQAWGIDRDRVQAVFPVDLANDLFPANDDAEAFLEALEYGYGETPASDGLVEVRVLRGRVCEVLGVPAGEQAAYFNRQVAALWGHITVARSLGHTAAATDCLFNDPGKQYVELIF